jgi:organic radical activating enzyme
MDEVLIKYLHEKQFTIAIETNGTIPVPAGIDWICMSPKPNTVIEVTKGNELKFVPSEFEHLDFEHFYIQPMDSPTLKENMKLALDYCLSNPKWKLSLQTHKILEIR